MVCWCAGVLACWLQVGGIRQGFPGVNIMFSINAYNIILIIILIVLISVVVVATVLYHTIIIE
jgi:hypothetical protein